MQETIESLPASLKAGDVAGADEMVVPEPRFERFSVNPERFDTGASDRESLSASFATQVADGYKAELHSFDFTFYRPEDRTGNFGFSLVQRSDSQGDTAASGKGGVDCDSGLIMVWTVGPREPA